MRGGASIASDHSVAIDISDDDVEVGAHQTDDASELQEAIAFSLEPNDPIQEFERLFAGATPDQQMALALRTPAWVVKAATEREAQANQQKLVDCVMTKVRQAGHTPNLGSSQHVLQRRSTFSNGDRLLDEALQRHNTSVLRAQRANGEHACRTVPLLAAPREMRTPASYANLEMLKKNWRMGMLIMLSR